MAKDNEAASYGDLLASALSPEIEWSEQDLRDILDHVLATSLTHLLVDVPVVPAETVGDYFSNPDASMDTLMRLKSFAKSCRSDLEGQLPKPIATVLYFASLAAAQVRHGRAETTLESEGLCEGYRWMTSCGWVSADLKTLASQAIERCCESLNRNAPRHPAE